MPFVEDSHRFAFGDGDASLSIEAHVPGPCSGRLNANELTTRAFARMSISRFRSNPRTIQPKHVKGSRFVENRERFAVRRPVDADDCLVEFLDELGRIRRKRPNPELFSLCRESDLISFRVPNDFGRDRPRPAPTASAGRANRPSSQS